MRTRAGLSLLLGLGLLLLLAAAAPVAAAEPSASPGPEPTVEPSPSPAPTAAPVPEPADEDPSPSPSPDPTPSPSPDPSPSPSPSPDPSPEPQPQAQPFSMNLYRSAGYVRQYTSAWCTAAATQMMGNFARLSVSSSAWVDRWFGRQYEIIRYAKRNDTLAQSAGTDPAGWAAALRRFGAGSEYAWRKHADYDTALRFAVERMRATGRPVGLLAANGKHAWVLHGFTATADPAETSDYRVTGLRVSGPLAGRDPRNAWISPSYLKVRWGRYYERDGYRGWVGNYVLVAP